MLKRNNIWPGILAGFVLPGIVFFVAEILKKDMRLLGKDNIFYVLSLAVNLLVIRYYFRSGGEETARGVVLSTFVSALIFFIFKGRS